MAAPVGVSPACCAKPTRTGREKLTTSEPAPLMSERREIGRRRRAHQMRSLGGRCLHQLGRAMHGFQDAHMRAAAAEMRLERAPDLAIGRLHVLLQQRLGAHHHAGDAIAALGGLFLDEGLLDRRRLFDVAQPLERRYLTTFEQQDRRDAGKYCLAVDHHRAGAALAEAAAIFGGVELEMIAQHIEQRRIGIGIDAAGLAVDGEFDHGSLSVARG